MQKLDVARTHYSHNNYLMVTSYIIAMCMRMQRMMTTIFVEQHPSNVVDVLEPVSMEKNVSEPTHQQSR